MKIRRSAIAGVCIGTVTMFLCGCDRRTDSSPTFIPGPSAPDVQTAVPLMWDTATELAAWASNAASQGSISVEGSGSAAFIRVLTGAQLPTIPATNFNFLKAVLRGPDLNPPRSFTGLRIRFRWVFTSPNSHTPCNCWNPDFVFQTDQPPWRTEFLGWDAGGRIEAKMAGTPGAADWREAFFPNYSRPSDAIRYLFVAFVTYANSGPVLESPGQFDIDWLRIDHN